jgi:hypothetical protein
MIEARGFSQLIAEGAAMNAKVQFTCPHCNHQMKLPSSTVGKQGKCPSCSAVITITASQPAGPSANQVPVTPQQPSAAIISPQPVQRVQQQAPAAVASPTPQPTAKPRKSRWKLLCITHILTAALTIGLMPYWKPHLEPLFPADYLAQNSTSGFADIDDLGKAVLAAIASRDPDKIMNLYVTPEVGQRFKERLMEAAEDPLKRELIDKGVRPGDLLRGNRLLNPTEESNEFQAKYQRIRDKCVRFLSAIDSESRDLTFDQINEATFLGMAPMRMSDNGLKEAFNIDTDEVGYMGAGNARVFILHEEKVYVISVDSMEKVLDRWYISGDFFSTDGPYERKFDLTEDTWQHPHAQATLRKVNQYLPEDSN